MWSCNLIEIMLILIHTNLNIYAVLKLSIICNKYVYICFKMCLYVKHINNFFFFSKELKIPSSNLLLACQKKVSWDFFPLFGILQNYWFLDSVYIAPTNWIKKYMVLEDAIKREKSVMKLLFGMPRVGYSTVSRYLLD